MKTFWRDQYKALIYEDSLIFTSIVFQAYSSIQENKKTQNEMHMHHNISQNVTRNIY